MDIFNVWNMHLKENAFENVVYKMVAIRFGAFGKIFAECIKAIEDL